jgi:hypothetical protein
MYVEKYNQALEIALVLWIHIDPSNVNFNDEVIKHTKVIVHHDDTLFSIITIVYKHQNLY